MLAFSYIDLVLEDTPIDQAGVEEKLRDLVQEVDNLSDRQDQKRDRMAVRFRRVSAFLDYLRSEEEREIGEFDLQRRGGLWADPFMPDISTQVEHEIQWIDRRLQENAEKTTDDLAWDPMDDDEPDSFDDEAADAISQDELASSPD